MGRSCSSAGIRIAAVSGATGYLVERAESSDPNAFSRLGDAVGAPPFDDAVAQGVSYSYRVAAVSAGDTSAFSMAGLVGTGLNEGLLKHLT